jgi:cellulose biosynthesis protein BcsQ
MLEDIESITNSVPERLVDEGFAVRANDFHGHRVYLIDTDYVLDNFFGAYNKSYDGTARDALLHIEDERQSEVTRIISEQGFRAPIAVSGGLQLVDGHARLGAAAELGMDRVPVSFSVFYGVQSQELELSSDPISASV